jgi:hypothetical protein
MKEFFVVAMFLMCLSKIIYAQDPTIFPLPGTITHCPGEAVQYEVQTTGAQQTGCTYKWESQMEQYYKMIMLSKR